MDTASAHPTTERILPLLAGLWILGVIILYTAIIHGQSNTSGIAPRVPFITGFLAALALAESAGTFMRSARLQIFLLAFAAAGLLATGILAILSIGIVILPAAAVATMSLAQNMRRSLTVVASLGAVSATGILAWGLLTFSSRESRNQPRSFSTHLMSVLKQTINGLKNAPPRIRIRVPDINRTPRVRDADHVIRN